MWRHRHARRPFRFGIGDEAIVSLVGLLICLLSWVPSAAAQTIYLKNGKVIEAKILERSDRSVQVDWFGVTLTYWLDDIDHIDEKGGTAPTIRKASKDTPLEAGTTSAPTPPSNQSSLIESVLTLSGITAQIDRASEQFQERMQQSFGGLSQAEAARITSLMSDVFDSHDLHASLISTFGRAFDQARFSRLLMWWQSPLAHTMVQLQWSTRNDTATASDMKAFMDDLKQHPVPPQRRALVERLETAMHAADAVIEVNTAVMQGIGTMLSADNAKKATDLDRLVAKMKREYEMERRDQVVAALEVAALFLYRSVPDDQLETYVKFWESDDGQWFNIQTRQAIVEALTHMSERLGAGLVSLKETSAPVKDTPTPVRARPKR